MHKHLYERQRLIEEMNGQLARLEKAISLNEIARKGDHTRWNDKNFWARQKRAKYLVKNRGDI